MANKNEQDFWFKFRGKDQTKAAVASVQHGLKSLGTGFTLLQGPLGGISGRLSSLSSAFTSFNPLMLAGSAAVAGYLAILKSSVSEFAEFERQNLRINGVLKATGNAAGLTGKQISDFANNLAHDTLASEKGVKDAAGALLTFKSITGDTFKRTLTVAQDLSEVLGQDLRQSTVQLGKALEDPTTGLNALRRSGVSFTSAWRDMILQMYASGKAADAQKLILAELEKQVGGAGKGAAGGMAGAIDSMSQSWEHFKIAIGNNETIKNSLNEIANGLEKVSHFINPDEQDRLNKLYEDRNRLQFQYDEAQRAGVNQSILDERQKKIDILTNEIILIELNINGRAKYNQKLKETAEIKQRIAGQLEADHTAEKAYYDDEIKAEEKRIKARKEWEKLVVQSAKTQQQHEFTGNTNAQANLKQIKESFMTEQQLLDQNLYLREIKLTADYKRGFITKEQRHEAFAILELQHQKRLTEIQNSESERRYKFNQAIHKRELNGVAQGFGAIMQLSQGHSKRVFNIAKKGAAATAFVKAYEAFNEARALPPGPPISYIWAVPALLAGLANVKAINSATFESGGSAGGGGMAGISSTGSIANAPNLNANLPNGANFESKKTHIQVVGAEPGKYIESTVLAKALAQAHDSSEITIEFQGQRADVTASV